MSFSLHSITFVFFSHFISSRNYTDCSTANQLLVLCKHSRFISIEGSVIECTSSGVVTGSRTSVSAILSEGTDTILRVKQGEVLLFFISAGFFSWVSAPRVFDAGYEPELLLYPFGFLKGTASS